MFAHIPLWMVAPDWGWGTEDGGQALAMLNRFGSATVLNGHIHQLMQKVEGNVTFHTARSTAFPQPVPGTAPGPGPKLVPAGELRKYLGVAEVVYAPSNAPLAITELGAAVMRLAILLIALASPAARGGRSRRGAQVYEGCQDCHSIDKNDVGPRHRGVFGRKAGSLTDYDYSPALKGAGFVWDEKTLDKWLTDPQAFLPGVRMFYHLAEEKDRADVIAFLRDRAR